METESMSTPDTGPGLTPREQMLIQRAIEHGMSPDDARTIVQSSMVSARTEKGMKGEDQERECAFRVAKQLGEDPNKLWAEVVDEQEQSKRTIH